MAGKILKKGDNHLSIPGSSGGFINLLPLLTSEMVQNEEENAKKKSRKNGKHVEKLSKKLRKNGRNR